MSLFKELKRRNVFRVAAAYVVIGWLLLQIATTLTPALHLPKWIVSAIALFLILGFIPAMLFSWAYELTPEGLKKDSEVDKSNSNTPQTAKKLDLITLVAVVGIAGLIGWQQMNPATVQTSDLNEMGSPIESSSAQAVQGKDGVVVGNDVVVNNKSIAVLPFIPLSSDENDAYFGKGIAEELLNALAKFPELKVAARTSAFSFDGKDVDLREVGSKLGVAHVLEGSVRSAGDKVRVTAQLIRAADGFHLWSETYDRDMKDIFAVQDDIVKQISRTLQIQLGVGAGSGRSAATRINPQAYQNYLRGLDLWGARSKAENRSGAIKAFQLATDQDPGFADAWAAYGMSLARSTPLEHDMSLTEQIAAEKIAMQTALSLDPDNARAISVSAILSISRELDIKQAMSLAARAVEIAPNASVTHYLQAEVFFLNGEYTNARRAIDRAVALDPLNIVVQRVRAEYSASMGMLSKVADVFENCTECELMERIYLARAQFMAARRTGTDEDVRRSARVANTLAKQYIDQDPSLNFVHAYLATTEPDFVEWLLGGQRPALGRLKWLNEFDVEESFVSDRFAFVFSDALLLARVGETDLAFKILNRAFENQLILLQMIIEPTGRDAWPEAFRRDPRFHAFWKNPGMPALAELLRKKGKTLGLPLPIEGTD